MLQTLQHRNAVQCPRSLRSFAHAELVQLPPSIKIMLGLPKLFSDGFTCNSARFEVESCLDGHDIVWLACCNQALRRRMSIADAGSGKMILRVQNIVASITTRGALEAFLQQIHLGSLIRLEISASSALLREIVVCISQLAPLLPYVVNLAFGLCEPN